MRTPRGGDLAAADGVEPYDRDQRDRQPTEDDHNAASLHAKASL